MSSIKRKDEIQKSVEESILDVVTRFKKDEPSFNDYDNSRRMTEEDLIHEDPAAQSLWNLAKNSPTNLNKEKVPLKPGDLGINPKIFGDAGATKPVTKHVDKQSKKPPVFSKAEVPNSLQPNVDGLPDAAGGGNGIGVVPPIPKLNLPEAGFEYHPQGLANLNAIQLKLYEGDHLKIAQQRIEDLERELERLRIENEKLASAIDLFQKKSEENLAAKIEIEKKFNFNEQRFAEDRLNLKNHLEQRDDLNKELKEKVSDLEARLSIDIRKSRSRERELENRLELARLEKISFVGSKDEFILDLKRQVDQLNHELGNYRRKAAEMNQTIEANQEQFRRTVRALRLALTNLEVNEQIGGRTKKAE
jgi:hypothetical protein